MPNESIEIIPHRAQSFNGGEGVIIPKLPQHYRWEATAAIWKKGDGKAAIGHAAIALRRGSSENPTFEDLNEQRWVSWVPVGQDKNQNDVRQGMFQKCYAHDMRMETRYTTGLALNNRWFDAREKQLVVGRSEKTYTSPKDNSSVAWREQWGTEADLFVPMAAFGPTMIGIDMNRIVHWCVNFNRSTTSYYDLVSNTNNCASVAWLALEAGGGKAFSKIFGSFPNHITYITPMEFYAYCMQIAQGIDRINNDFREIKRLKDLKIQNNPGLKLGAKKGFGFAPDIYSYRDWMQESDVAWKIRGFILRRIDNAIENYHNLKWDTNYSEKLYELLVIIHNLEEHLRKSESGKRDPAMCALASQVDLVVERLRADVMKAWQTDDYYVQGVAKKDVARQGMRNPFQVIADGLRGLIS